MKPGLKLYNFNPGFFFFREDGTKGQSVPTLRAIRICTKGYIHVINRLIYFKV